MTNNKKQISLCAECTHYDEAGHCTSPKGLLHGIRISESMAEAEHDCSEYDPCTYTLSEAAHLRIAMKEEGVEVEFETAKSICDRFFESMVRAGLLKKSGDE